MAKPEQDAWIARVLGVAIVAPSTAQDDSSAGDNPAARWIGLWQDAKESVDDGINKLAAALREEGDPDLDQIADRGLIGITGGNSVRLTKALLGLRTAGPDALPAATAALREAASSYQASVLAHPMVDLIDENPWNIEVGIRAKLDAALQAIIDEAA